MRADPDITLGRDDELRPLEVAGFSSSIWDASPLGTQPRSVFRMDLKCEPEALFAALHRTARRCIRTAQRKGVTVQADDSERGLEHFLALHAQTLGRQGYLRLPEAYFHALHREMVRPGAARYWLARHEGRVVAATLTCDFGRRSWYLYAGFDYAARQLMAPHLNLWTAIRAAQDAGHLWFDLRGTGLGPGEVMSEDHPLHGIHRYKLQFSPREETFVPEQEIVCRPLQERVFLGALPLLLRGAHAAKTFARWRYRG